jgi:hypothetical protein
VEQDFGQERFLTDQPNKLFREGHFHHVPVIAGTVQDEQISPVPSEIIHDIFF